ncbi:MAG: hypothetical protein JJT96_20630 [Opitutales bacterium]|nr:hypothetical protein [Opitutales bacterium]
MLRHRFPLFWMPPFAALAGLAVALAVVLISACAPAGRGERTDIRWGTSAVGSSGHRALVQLAAALNREWEDTSITVLPMAGAIMTMRAYGAGNLDAFYGSDVAFHEWASNSGRFEGTRDSLRRPPVQSFWAFSMEMGLAIRAADAENLRQWSDLSGRRVFTGPAPWDTRAHLERLFRALGVEHRYADMDLGVVGSQLAAGSLDAFGVYTTGRRALAPWVAEAERVTPLRLLAPSADEEARLREAGFEVARIPTAVFQTNVGAAEAVFSPFYYGFHVGTSQSADFVYDFLVTVERLAPNLAALDPVFTVLAADMAGLQRRGVARAVADVPVHPGLARFLRERGQWDSAWDDRIAQLP